MFKLFLISFFILNKVMAAELFYIQGTVKVNGEERTRGYKLSIGDLVEVSDESLAIVSFDSGAKSKLLENTFLKIVEDNSKKSSVELTIGSLMAKVQKMDGGEKDKFIVKAKNVAMGVRGTEFFVSYGKANSDDLWMCVAEGLVAVKNDKVASEVLVKKGEGVRITKTNISAPRPLPWTQKLNWNMDETKKLELNISIEEAYSDPLGQDYD